MKGLTKPQQEAMDWLPKHPTMGRHWTGIAWGSPSKGALRALIARGLAETVGVTSMDMYRLTDAGRALRASATEARQGRDEGSAREGAAPSGETPDLSSPTKGRREG